MDERLTKPRAQIRLLPDGRRLHLHDGPIDIVLEAWAEPAALAAAYRAAAARFVTILDELCAELPLLRARAGAKAVKPAGRIARRMFHAVLPFAEEHFITPMAAVAGAVAEEVLQAMTESARLSRAYVNDGGDIAIHLTPGESFSVAMVNRPDQPALFGSLSLHSADPVRGIATSGWRGRSFSRGIADAVTVLAETSSMTDAAATIIANAVDLPGHPAITRAPARELVPDSDLNEIFVTTAVGELTIAEIDAALARGAECAEDLRNRRLIHAAALHLRENTRIVKPASAIPHIGAGDRSLVYA